MKPPAPDPKLHPIAQAYRWISIVITAVLMMVLPGIAGGWLDKRFGTGWMTLGGIAVGLILGIYYLLSALPKPPSSKRPVASRKTGNEPPHADRP